MPAGVRHVRAVAPLARGVRDRAPRDVSRGGGAGRRDARRAGGRGRRGRARGGGARGLRSVPARAPKAFRAALAENALRAAETAVADGSADFDAVAAEAATRLFDAAVRGVDDFETGASKASVLAKRIQTVHARNTRNSARAVPDARAERVRAAPVACLRQRLRRRARRRRRSGRRRRHGEPGAARAVAGHAASASVDAAVVTRLCVSVSLASIALPAPPCVAAGVRLATAAGLTSSTRAHRGRRAGGGGGADGAAGASPPEAAAALVGARDFLTPPPAEAEDDDEARTTAEGAERESRGGDSFASSRRSAREPGRARGDSGRRLRPLSALPEDDGVAGSLDEFAILTCALLSAAVHRRRAPTCAIARGGPDGHRPRCRRVRTGRGAIRRARARRVLERFRARIGIHSKSVTAEARVAFTRTHNRHNRRAFSGTPAAPWARRARPRRPGLRRCARWRRRRRRPSLTPTRAWRRRTCWWRGWTRASTRRERAPGRPRHLAAAASGAGGRWTARAAHAGRVLGAASRDVTAESPPSSTPCSRARRAHAARRRRERRRQGAPGALGPGRRARRGRRRRSRRRSARAGDATRAPSYAASPRGRGPAEALGSRWTWLADAAADAENLLAGTARGAAASTPKWIAPYARRGARARAARLGDSDGGSEGGGSEPTKRRRVRAFDSWAASRPNSAAATAPSTAARARLARRGVRATEPVDPLFTCCSSRRRRAGRARR